MLRLLLNRWRSWISPAARKGRHRAQEQALALERAKLVEQVAEISQKYADKKYAPNR